jgi:hypothetical protein
MRNIIDVMLVVDTNQITQDHPGNAEGVYAPLNRYGEGYVFMLGPWSNVAHQTDTSEVASSQQGDHQEEEGGYELKLHATVGDTIRFRIQSLALGGGYPCFLHQFNVTRQMECVTAPIPRHFSIASTTLDHAEFQPVVGAAEDHCWETTMLRPGTVTYDASFVIYDDTAKRVGGYFFDPWIVVAP